jgi:prepilin-type N-terminal cleavage/methylation domain-containing protein
MKVHFMKLRNQLQARPLRENGLCARRGFTFIELVVVVAIVAMLAALLLPGLARGTQQGEAWQCLGSLKQLTESWLMYNSENRGRFTPNGGEGAQGGTSPTDPNLKPGQLYAQWCRIRMA